MAHNIKYDPDSACNADPKNEGDGIKQEKKIEIPSKSSMEILSELFSTFDSEPPLIIKEEKLEKSIGKKHKKDKKKKHKHKESKHKKKSKKRHSVSSSSNEELKVDLAEILIKQEANSSIKKMTIHGTDLKLNINANAIMENESDSKTPEGSPKVDHLKKNKILIQDLKKSLLEKVKEKSKTDESDSHIKEKKHKKKHKHKLKKRKRSKSKERYGKKIKLNDIKDVLSDKESKSTSYKYADRSPVDDFDEYKNKDKDEVKERSHDKYKHNYFKEVSDYRRSRRDNPFYKSYKSEITQKSNERDRGNRWSSRDR